MNSFIKNSIALLILTCCLTSFPLQLKSQFEKKGILVKNTLSDKKGDTISLYGYRLSFDNSGQYLVKGSPFRFIDSKKVTLVDLLCDFWEDIWFSTRAVDIKKDGWEHQYRLTGDAKEFYNLALQNNLIYYDDFFYDYLYYLINKIHPTKLIKNKASNFTIVIMKSNEEKSFVFDNGLIVLTTGLIAKTKSEKELVILLAKCISHVVLEHNLQNLKQQLQLIDRDELWGSVSAAVSAIGMTYNYKNNSHSSTDEIFLISASGYLFKSSVLKEIGAEYSEAQLKHSQIIANNYYKLNEKKFTLTDKDYFSKISNIIRYTAWQYFHALDYYKSLELIEKKLIQQNGRLTNEDCLLLVKLKRLIGSSGENNQGILDIINKVKEKEPLLIEFYKEEAMICIRMKQNKKAIEALLNYKKGLIKMQNEGINVYSEIANVEQMIQNL